jgi:phosphate butyryltransferase
MREVSDMLSNFDDLLFKAKELPISRMALAAPYDINTLKAVKLAEEKGLVETILVGCRQRLIKSAEEINYELDEAQIIDAEDNIAAASKAVKQVKIGEADFLMKGLLKTSTVLKAVLDSESGLRTGRLLSYVGVLEIPKLDRLVLMTDPAINIKPNLEEKKEIVQNAIELAHALGMDKPKVAALAAIEKINKKMPATVDAAVLAKMSDNGQIKGGVVDGPLAFDNAISQEAKEIKGVKGEVAGQADVFLVPYIEVGNVLYKTLTYLADTKIAGVVMGAKVPIAMSSRSDTYINKLISIALSKVIADKTFKK